MQYLGVIIHHSACPSINGKGYDFLIAKDGAIIPSSEQTDPEYIHICIEGDYTYSHYPLSPQEIEQFFLSNKLISRLSTSFSFTSEDLLGHTPACPGTYFPWSKLVISFKDGYH